MPCSSLIYYNFFNKPLSAGLQLQFVETARTVTAPVSNRWGNLKIYLYAIVTEGVCNNQRWSRGHKARDQGQGHKRIRGQGQGQPFREQILSRPRTEMLEAKDQGHSRKCSPKKKVFKIFFRRSLIHWRTQNF